MHAWLELTDRKEALLFGQERMLLVGMQHLAVLVYFPIRPFDGGRQRQIHQVGVVSEPEVLDGLQLHLFGAWVIRPDLLAHFQRADGLLAMLCRHQGTGSETERTSDSAL